MPNITPLPVPPTRQDPSNFNDRADEFLAALESPFVPELNALRLEVLNAQSGANTSATAAATSASTAQGAADSAQAFANAFMWDAATFYAVGDLAISPTDFEPYRRIVAGTTSTDPAADPTNWIKAADYYTKAETYSKAETDALLVTAVPPGAILYFAMNAAPSGYLKANGALVSRTTFANLFAAIGTTYGAGNGSTTFALPDLRAVFPRGWDDGRFVDAGRVFGSEQDDATAQETGRADFAGSASNGDRVRNAAGIMSISSGSNFQRTETGATNVTSQRVTVTIGSGPETRPRNVALLACIKF